MGMADSSPPISWSFQSLEAQLTKIKGSLTVFACYALNNLAVDGKHMLQNGGVGA